MSAPVLDRDHLARYTGGDSALEAELFALLSGQIDVCIARLKSASAEAGWKDAAHTLKGAARGVGAMALGDACAQAETAPLNHEALAAVEAEAERAQAAMKAA
jgi:HPt (histidine-containing phosphotransfer) domain-containing protein